MSNDSIYVNSGDIIHDVNKHAAMLASTESQFERGYAHLGWLLLEVRQMGYWRVHHESFGDYLKTVAQISKKSPSQLNLYVNTVRDLTDTFTPEQLELMGITKAIKLRNAQDYAVVLPKAIVSAALDPQVTVKELRQVISAELKMPEEEGDWFELEGFMVSAEERQLLEQAIDVAKHTEPLTKDNIALSAQMKDVMVKFCQEFLGAHSGDGQ